jgi:hypothetical protein
MAKFTDNQLAKLFTQLTKDYNELTVAQKSSTEIEAELTRRVLFSLNSPASNLYWQHLADPRDETACRREADKVMHALTIFLSARPALKHLRKETRQESRFEECNVHLHYDYARYQDSGYRGYCASDDLLFNWLLYRSLLSPQVIVVDHSSNHDHSHGDEKKKEDAIAYLFLAALSVLFAALAVVALYYMLGQALNSIDRIRYNEGVLQGMWTMAGTLAAGCVSYFLSMAFVASPLMNLALLAGISSPVSVVVLSLSCLVMIGAGLGCLMTDKAQNYILRRANPGALDPNDPDRFALTLEEEENLRAKGFDVMKVKYVIYTLRSELGEQGVPTLMHSRFFGNNGMKIQENLDLIRKIRAGDLGNGYGEIARSVVLRQGKQTINFDMAMSCDPTTSAPPPSYAP